MDTTLERFGRVDVLVSNAGIDCESPVADLDVDLLDRCLAVNVRAPLLLCKFAFPAMFAQGTGGSIFRITSGSAKAYREGRIGYSKSTNGRGHIPQNGAPERGSKMRRVNRYQSLVLRGR